MKQILLIFTVFLITSCVSEQKKDEVNSGINEVNHQAQDLSSMLDKWSNVFIKKIDSNYSASINFKLVNSSESYNISIYNNSYKIFETAIDSANFTFKSTLHHYNKIFNEEMTAMTSMGQASPKDPIPLIPELHKPITDNLLNDFLFFSQRFFNRTIYDRVKLGIDHSRIVHGGHAIPIFYQKSEDVGVRSAWYQINKGEQVNEIGDTNPFPQYFIINEGRGFAKIGRDTITIKAKEAYFIPAHHDHVFWNENEEPLTMIFLAWGKGA